MALARPVISSPANVTRTCWPSVPQRRRTSSARARRPGALFEQHTPGFEGAEEMVQEDQSVHRLPQVVQAGAARFRGPRPGHVDPDADHDGRHGGPGELRLGQDAGQLGPLEQQVIGPFEDRLDPGQLPAGISPGQGHRPGAQVQVAAVEVGSEEHRGQQIRPGRRLPAAVEPPPAGGLMVRHRDESGGSPVASPITDPGVGRVDLEEPVDVPLTGPHGRHHRVRAIVKVRLREEMPA